MPKKILFVCLGNICRSAMAEFIMKDKVKHYGAENAFEIASAATSDEEYGNPIYPPIQRFLREHNIYFNPQKTSRQLTQKDYDYYDYIIGMDESNRKNILCITHGDPNHKVSLYTPSIKKYKKQKIKSAFSSTCKKAFSNEMYN